MSYDGEVLRRATARLTAQRERQAQSQETLRREIYNALPRVAEIDKELRGTIAQIIATSFREGTDPRPAIGVLRDKNLTLQVERSALLTAQGYAEDALDDHPLCAKCNDSGWQGATICDCLKVLCAQEQIAQLSQLLNLGEQSFDRFDLSWYGEQPWPGESHTPRYNMEFIRELCWNYAHKFGKFYFKNLLLTGGPGLGKTFLSACIARTVSENGFSVVYDTATNIFSQFETGKFSRDEVDTRSAKDEMRRYLNCDLLILDDLGSELTTPFVQSTIYQLLNTRLVEGRQTVISTNLSMDDVRQRYSPQVASRLEGEYHSLRFYGDDIRLLRKAKI